MYLLRWALMIPIALIAAVIAYYFGLFIFRNFLVGWFFNSESDVVWILSELFGSIFMESFYIFVGVKVAPDIKKRGLIMFTSITTAILIFLIIVGVLTSDWRGAVNLGVVTIAMLISAAVVYSDGEIPDIPGKPYMN